MGADSEQFHEVPREYDVCLSFAGEDRDFVHEAADALKERGIRVFYDEYEKAVLWGKDLFEHLDYVYRRAARYCVLFVSSAYAEKLWTNHERRSAQARAFSESSEYILPARLDDTEIPGLPPTVGYVDLASMSPQELAELVVEKLGPRAQVEFFPPKPNHLWEHFGVDFETDELIADNIHQRAQGFFDALQRMDGREREVVFQLLLECCPAELPVSVHIKTDLLRRVTGLPVDELKSVLGKLQSLGFYVRHPPEGSAHPEPGEEPEFLGDSHGDPSDFALEWHLMTPDEEAGGNATAVAEAMVTLATEGMCTDCALRRLHRLDFGNLASATRSEEEHLVQGE